MTICPLGRASAPAGSCPLAGVCPVALLWSLRGCVEFVEVRVVGELREELTAHASPPLWGR